MSETKLSAQKMILVHLVRPGEEAREFRLREGATLGDLLRQAGEARTGPSILVGGTPVEDALVLREGITVTLPTPPWAAKIKSFEDEELYQEYMDILKKNREEWDFGEGESE